MIEPVAPPAASIEGSHLRPADSGETPATPERPSESQAAEFSDAVAIPAVREVDAAPVPPASGLAAGVVHRLEDATSQLDVFAAGRNSSSAAAGGSHANLDSSRQFISDAIAQTERAYIFAIETTMASRGSTEATKILNTLLKGQ